MARQTILLADDSITIRKVVEMTFADEDIDVVSVSDGDAAMQKFVEISPDLVLADVNMPGMSGYQICEMIKQDDSTSHIPVILLVGSFEPFDPGEASRVGSNYYFTKPFSSVRELVVKVREYLELGAFDKTTPETVDIDDLYHRSVTTRDELEDTIANYDDMPAIGDDPADERSADEPIESEVENEPVAAAAADVSPVELGDAGMDDEMIETSHPGAEPREDVGTAPIDPFESTVTDAQAVTESPSSPLRFALDDVEPDTDEPDEHVRFAERDGDQSPAALTIDNISTELIELIVGKVMDRLSDTAVRDIAREMVPQITEKLIREALDEDKKS